MSKVERIFISAPDAGNANIRPRQPIDLASWLWHPGVGNGERAFLLFRKSFEASSEALTIHVSADERYELLLDGRRISRGPHRGDLNHWAYSSYKLELEPGRHEFTALVWAFYSKSEEWSSNWASPVAQISWRGGFVFKAEGDFYDRQLTSGTASWSVARAGGWKPLPVTTPGVFGVGSPFEWTGGAEAAEAETSASVVRGPVVDCNYGEPVFGWKLEPSPLPDMLDRELRVGTPVAAGPGHPDTKFPFEAEFLASPRKEAWARTLKGESPISIPAGTEEFVLVDLGDYFTGYPLLELTGGKGSTVGWSWAESLFDSHNQHFKGQRDGVEGKFFIGMDDIFRSDGRDRLMSVPWWRAGRYCLISVKTGAEALGIRRIAIDETGYPLSMDAKLSAPTPDLDAIARICVRAMRACSHETFMDCPYYEQLMYVGDTRLEMLTTHVMSADGRLVRRCIELFDHSRVNFGFVNERYPANRPQHSPTFSMIWALMLHDFVLWRKPGDAWLTERMVSLRSMLEHFNPYLNADGLLERLPGWPFMDWTPEWKVGVPHGGYDGVSSSINLLYALSLQRSAELEDFAKEPLLASRLREKAASVIDATMKLFWCERRKMLADDEAKGIFSEQAQALAILTGAVKGAKGKALLEELVSAKDLVKASSYFIFYLFEAFRLLGRADLIQPRLDMWRDMLKLGFKTTPEEPRPGTRSDCHAWSAQILFHLYASIAGIRPSSPGFRTVRIEPQLGAWKSLSASMPHADGGMIELEIVDGKASIELPEGLTGSFVWKGREHALKSGRQDFKLA